MSVATKEFYANDIVCRLEKKRKINFGVVIDSWEGSTDSDEFTLQKGQVRVWWFNTSEETVIKQHKIKLISRSIIPGDTICRLNGKNVQKGYCKEFKQYATVQVVGTDKIIENVPAQRLSMITPYLNNDAVCLGNKFGRILHVDQKLKMLAKCGSTVEVFASLNHEIYDYWLTKRFGGFFEYFYPGEEVVCVPNNLVQPHWILQTKTMKHSMSLKQRFIILNVEPTDIEITWHDSAAGVSSSILKNEELTDLKVVETSERGHLSDLAERRLLKLSSSDTVINKHKWMRKQWSLYQPEYFRFNHSKIGISNSSHHKKKESKTKIRRPFQISTEKKPSSENEEGWLTEEEISDDTSFCSTSSNSKCKKLVSGSLVAVEIVSIDSKATIVWQDGTQENNIPSTHLYFSISLDDHEFYPGEWVIEDKKSNELYGVIQNVNNTERTAKIKWFKLEDKKDVYVKTDEKSVYDLKKRVKFDFRPGSVVKKVPTESNKLGSVIDSHLEGYISVRWLDGTIENCSPNILDLIPETIEYELSLNDNDSVSEFSWETNSVESIVGGTTDEPILKTMETHLGVLRERVYNLKTMFLSHPVDDILLESFFPHFKELLTLYDNCSYLDKILDTSFFSLKSKHFQILLNKIKEKAKSLGIVLRGRLFTNSESINHTSTPKNIEKENLEKISRLEHKIQSQIQNVAENKEPPSSVTTPDSDPDYNPVDGNICVELLSMIKARLDLAYAEIVSRLGDPQALSVMTKASKQIKSSELKLSTIPTTPSTPDDSSLIPFLPDLLPSTPNEAFALLEEVPFTHHFISNDLEPSDKQKFYRTVQKEYKLLRESLPPGIWVRCYQNRLDLLSFMISGPAKTPYEDGLFIFDVKLSPGYASTPPVVHYISFSSERLNPNLYVEGKVCISLLGTWMGKGTEVWGSSSTLLQLIVSIQGLILVSEPFYNEAGYEKMVESDQGIENSRTYNEMVVLKLVQSMTEMILNPPIAFKEEIVTHFAQNGEKLIRRLENWCKDEVREDKPAFPLLPVSKGFKLSLKSAMTSFRETLAQILQEKQPKKED